jgi:hypothetical protein
MHARRQTARRIRSLHVIMDMRAADDVKEHLGQTKTRRWLPACMRRQGPCGRGSVAVPNGENARRQSEAVPTSYTYLLAVIVHVSILGEPTKRPCSFGSSLVLRAELMSLIPLR